MLEREYIVDAIAAHRHVVATLAQQFTRSRDGHVMIGAGAKSMRGEPHVWQAMLSAGYRLARIAINPERFMRC
jgi:hypothetical protein